MHLSNATKMNTTTPNSVPDGVPPEWAVKAAREIVNLWSLHRGDIIGIADTIHFNAPVPPSDDTALLCKQLEALQRNVPLGQYGDVYSRAITDAIRLLTATDAGDRGELVAKLITAHDLMKEHAAGLVMKDDLEQAIRALSAPSTPSRAGGTEEKT